ncbi:hypothetical protein ACH427_15550 [Streptomyces sp. NPDC020379]|uniref:effector-associated constant component EACC1 n=1 Tax=Streptomyces sp. NPDC020379 TaxID=3365071 RepID=UPI00378810AA
MRIRIDATTDEERGAVADLYEWLRQDPEVRRGATVERVRPFRSGGAMGTVEIINVILGQGFTALNLALSYASWRTARPTAPPIVINVAGRSIVAQDSSDETVRRLVEALERAADATDPE